jgi:beta-lactam-binding protein with PASTA domain/predicted Ser/Thr protein kinase
VPFPLFGACGQACPRKIGAVGTTIDRPPVGQVLDGRYRVESHLAHGGMADVYLATDIRLERAVALKIMRPEFASDQDFVRRFITEAKSVAALSHPNVVTVYDQGADGRILFLAMEYVPGRTLREALRERGRLSPREALDVMEQVLAGLAAAHHAGVAHRDVKPENVLLGPGHTVKVADFGLARLAAGPSHTRSGMIIGTAAYLAPEQVSGRGADARSDVYAAGVMLFELLTGTQPHVGENPLAVAYKHVNEAVRAPSSLVPGLPAALDTLVALATSRDPDLRPADAGQYLRAVSAARRGLPAGAAATSAGRGLDETLPPVPPVLAPVPPALLPVPPAPLALASDRTAPLASPGLSGPGEPLPGTSLQRTLVVAEPLGGPYGMPPPGQYPPRESRLQRLLFSRRLGYLALAAAAACVLGLLGWWVLTGRYTTVPTVAGQTVAAARADLSNAGLRASVSRARIDNRVAKGRVIATIPAGGTRIPRGGRVTLVVSAGPRMITMPQVTGQFLAAARSVLRRAGLELGKVTPTTSATIPVGIVISTDPPAGASWPQPSPVRLVVSAGPPVPDFVGQPRAAAQAWADQNGVQLAVETARASSQPAGIVLHQSVPPGHPFTRGQVIMIVVSPGPPLVSIPNVSGMRVNQAVRLLHRLGFQVSVEQFGPFQTVISYSPTGSAPKGSVITLMTGLPGFGG